MNLPASDTPWRHWARLFGVVVILNGFFLAAALWAASLPTEGFTSRVAAAFATGELDDSYCDCSMVTGFAAKVESQKAEAFAHHPQFNVRQYNDCLVLLIITDPDAVWWARALGPLKVEGDCFTLHGIVDGTVERSDLSSLRYTRYWFGFVPIVSALLRPFSLGEVRRGLKFTVYASLILLVLSAALRQRRVLPVVAVIALGCLGFWRLPEFSMSLVHGPGDTAVVLGLAALIFWHRFLMRAEIFAAYCGAYGAVVTYLEFLTGLIPTAAGFLFPLAYLLGAYPPGRDARPARGWTFAVTGLVAFGAGVLLTVLVKQLLTAFAVGGAATYQEFMVQLAVRASTDWPGVSSLPRRIVPYWMLMKASAPVDLHLVLGSSGIAWATAAILALYRGNWRACSDVAAFAVGAAAIVAWVQVLPQHTYEHYEFMVRILIVPITLGWAALIWLAPEERTSVV